MEWVVVDDVSTGLAMYRTGQLDCGPMEFWTVRQHDLEALQQSHPHLQYQDIQANGGALLAMRTDHPPFNDVRVRRAISMAFDRQALVAALAGRGQPTPAIPPGLVEWSLPIDQLGTGAKYYQYDPQEPDACWRKRALPRACRRSSLQRSARASGPISSIACS